MAGLAGIGTAPILAQSRPASSGTAQRNAAVLAQLPFSDDADFADAQRGLVAAFKGRIVNDGGETIWDTTTFDFLDSPQAPPSVNPSLWRMARLNKIAGLFRVTERVYQLRGFDLANITVVEGNAGLVVVDPLTSVETARAAMAFYFAHRPRKPVVAVIYTHSHADHFGGVRGVVDEADVKAGKVAIVAPAGFLAEAVSENVLAGNAMFRRGQYQTGRAVPRGDLGQVDTGLGKSTLGNGTISLIAPTREITQPFEAMQIAGVDFEFQLASGAEAPAEVQFYLPGERVLNMAENAVRTMHNVLTPRGAQVRDARQWSRYIDDSRVRYGDRSDVLIGQHHWPVWGGAAVRTFLTDQRDLYAWLNNNALRLLNQGKGPAQIADEMRDLPDSLAKRWYLRGYYGTASFNARAIYQRYLGFYDANPASLDPLPPADEARHWIAAIGGAKAAKRELHSAIDKGELRWAVRLGSNLVTAEPGDGEARELQARALEQLGYQSESAVWRNIYLQGAAELRAGVAKGGARAGGDMLRAMDPAMLFDLMAVRLNTAKAAGADMTIDWIVIDRAERYAMTLRGGILTWRKDAGEPDRIADATVSLTSAQLPAFSQGRMDVRQAAASGTVQVTGDIERLGRIFGLLDVFDPQFPIVSN